MVSIVKNAYCSFVLKCITIPPIFSSIPLQSGIFTCNRKTLIGLFSSIITAAMGYGIRFLLLSYLDYDVFANLDNLIASLGYFCSLGGIRFVIKEYLKEITFSMSYCGGTNPVSENRAGSRSLPVGRQPKGNIFTMQNPTNPGVGGSGSGSGSGSGGSGDTPLIKDRADLMQKINKVEVKLAYFKEQHLGATQDLDEVLSKIRKNQNPSMIEQLKKEHHNALHAFTDTRTNLTSELRMENILKTKLAKGDYSMSGTSGTNKRIFSDSSMANDNSSTNNKRTCDDE